MGDPVPETSIPRFSPGVRLRFDPVRESWVLLAPERLFMPDPQAAEILQLVDNARTLGDVVDALALRFNAPRETIAADVAEMLGELAAKGVIRL